MEIVRFRTDAKSVGDVIVERAADLNAAAVVRHLCPSFPLHSCWCATGVMGGHTLAVVLPCLLCSNFKLQVSHRQFLQKEFHHSQASHRLLLLGAGHEEA